MPHFLEFAWGEPELVLNKVIPEEVELLDDIDKFPIVLDCVPAIVKDVVGVTPIPTFPELFILILSVGEPASSKSLVENNILPGTESPSGDPSPSNFIPAADFLALPVWTPWAQIAPKLSLSFVAA